MPDNTPRGEVYDWQKFEQKPLFTGMVYGRISPTDIDVALEFNDELSIFMEVKSRGTPLTTGQRLLIERTCNHLSADGVEAFGFFVEHDCPTGHIPLAEQLITSIWHGGSNIQDWLPPKHPCPVNEAVIQLLRRYIKDRTLLTRYLATQGQTL